jgi:hypothetical protein
MTAPEGKPPAPKVASFTQTEDEKGALTQNVAERLSLREGCLRRLIAALDEDRMAGRQISAAAKKSQLKINRPLAKLRGDVNRLKIPQVDKKILLVLLK